MTLPDGDLTEVLTEHVRSAHARRTPLRIQGGDTKRFYGRPVDGEPLHLAGHAGVLTYDPAELVITVRAGTRLADVDELLRRHGQHLPFEPPQFGSAATIGGAVAAGLAGPARVSRGPVRDYVLGVRMLTGDGRVLRFGGEVMKNVAGYDISRLLVGSLGVLGVLLDVSLKVLPVPVTTRTQRQCIDAQGALELLASATQRGVPVSASHWHDGELHVRLEGSDAALDAVQPAIGGTPVPAAVADLFWIEVREQRNEFFTAATSLHRLSVPALAPIGEPSVPWAFEWNGAQRWLAGADRPTAEAIASAARGHCTVFRSLPDETHGEVFDPLPAALLELQRAVKRVFDPAGILNPGRLYATL